MYLITEYWLTFSLWLSLAIDYIIFNFIDPFTMHVTQAHRWFNPRLQLKWGSTFSTVLGTIIYVWSLIIKYNSTLFINWCKNFLATNYYLKCSISTSKYSLPIVTRSVKCYIIISDIVVRLNSKFTTIICNIKVCKYKSAPRMY